MKRLSLVFFALVLFLACKNDKEESAAGNPDSTLAPIDISGKNGGGVIDTANLTTVQWIDSLQDFGKVKDGEKVNISFRFKNTGNKPLIVEGVQAGCGCTVPEYTREPVMPGKEGFIKAVFNSTGQTPTVHKTISVNMNTKPTMGHTVAFIGEVIQP